MFLRKWSFLAAVTLFLSAGLFAAPDAIENKPSPDSATPAIELVKNRRAVCEILLPSRASEPLAYGANELQRWIGIITGAYVPINPVPGSASIKTKIHLGTGELPQEFWKDVGKLRFDGFAIRHKILENGEKHIYLFGSVDRGTLHAVYSFLERNTDIIWARPEEEIGTIYTEIDNLTVKDADCMDIPKSRLRGWQWVYHSPGAEGWNWESRNRMNRLGDSPKKYARMFERAGVGHGIQHYMPKSVYFKDHPEYFPMRNKSRKIWSDQLCYTEYSMIPEYVKNISAELAAKYPGIQPRQLKIDYLNLSVGDNWLVCECDRCLAPFKTEDGKTIMPEDKAFRSAQYYTFINKVVRELHKTYPNVTVGVYAYIFAAPPPPFKLERGIRIEYCPFVMNEKKPIYDDVVNANWHEYLDKWGAVGSFTQVREYFGWADIFPRSQEYRIRDNGQYYLKHNVLEYSCEHHVDAVSKVAPDAKMSWDVSGMTAWVVCRLWWDATQDIEQLRDYYLKRVYREAAPEMRLYYDTLRDSFYSSNLPTCYSDSLMPLVKSYITKPGLGDKLTGYLTAARKKASNPKSQELIDRQLKHITSWIEKAGNDKTMRLNVPCFTDVKDPLKSHDSAIWEKAGATGDFVICNTMKEAKFRSTAKLFHDRNDLYIRYDCFANDMAVLKANVRTGNDGVEQVPRGDIMEFFLGHADTGLYYQFMFDPGNDEDHSKDVVYDAKGNDPSWTCKWERSVKRYPDRWVAIVKIPLSEIGINVTQNNRLLFQAIRGKYYDVEVQTKDGKIKKERPREMASWTGGWVHQMDNFGELTLEQN